MCIIRFCIKFFTGFFNKNKCSQVHPAIAALEKDYADIYIPYYEDSLLCNNDMLYYDNEIKHNNLPIFKKEVSTQTDNYLNLPIGEYSVVKNNHNNYVDIYDAYDIIDYVEESYIINDDDISISIDDSIG
tara:strand:+ start:7909 stop:8298 length:390 start_codon:yes stop_codon:yes gene_type:complete